MAKKARRTTHRSKSIHSQTGKMTRDKLPFANISHLGWAVRDMSKALKYYEDLGMGPWYRYTLPSPGHDFQKREQFGSDGRDDMKYEVALAKCGPIVVELFEPVSGDSILKRFMDSKGEGIWHIGYLVKKEEFDWAVAKMTKKGFKVIGSSIWKSGTRTIFFDTDKVGGIIFQLHDYPSEFAALLSTMGLVL